jgi:hypothetical protein
MWALAAIIMTIGFATAYFYRWLAMPVIFYPVLCFVINLGNALARDVEHDSWGSIDPGFYFFQHYLATALIIVTILAGLILSGRRGRGAGTPRVPMGASL